MCAANPGVVLGLYRSRHERDVIEAAHRLGVRTLDTAYNYLGFRSHATLRRLLGDLLGEFDISTKVGFFPGSDGRPVHSLEPTQLADAVEKAAEDLGKAPAVVLLHNPERSLNELGSGEATDQLWAAGAVLQRAVDTGLAGAWGMSTWHAEHMTRVLLDMPAVERPRPQILMVRAGLLVGAAELDAGERLARQLDVDEMWGMSPFGGDVDRAIWDKVDARMFMDPGSRSTWRQAAFRVAAELPLVDQVVVGTNSVDHLAELVAATTLQPRLETVAAYRDLLKSRSKRTHQPTS